LIEPGTEAPDFELRNQEGEKVRLSDLRGRKVLLVFYPLDFSPVCTDQLSVYEEALPQWKEAGAEVFGVSVDSAFCHKAFQDKLGITMPLLADFEPKGEVARHYGAYIEKHGTANRSLVLIDEEGVVAWSHASPSPLEIPSADLVLEALSPAK
jgi:peroxiredoxin (alkyl hydroperoxide reductase subunit C)